MPGKEEKRFHLRVPNAHGPLFREGIRGKPAGADRAHSLSWSRYFAVRVLPGFRMQPPRISSLTGGHLRPRGKEPLNPHGAAYGASPPGHSGFLPSPYVRRRREGDGPQAPADSGPRPLPRQNLSRGRSRGHGHRIDRQRRQGPPGRLRYA
ncbi:hypothetical protein Sfulv_50060 [Streptomyces fulvorobeus]|uniref:Uncharacterized protein n=1 Tax=Streptomyces fulvorobeus TaxID=284028 RepID=A0A7J0CCE3_9ACTN|nr:hypothetical protein Sfulv_50060 [Streptomyces fulvorobeus]